MEIHPIKYKDSIQYILRIMAFRWMISSFVGDICFCLADIFFWFRQKKYHQQAKLSSYGNTPLCIWYFLFLSSLLKFRDFSVKIHYASKKFLKYFKHLWSWVFQNFNKKASAKILGHFLLTKLSSNRNIVILTIWRFYATNLISA